MIIASTFNGKCFDSFRYLKDFILRRADPKAGFYMSALLLKGISPDKIWEPPHMV